MLVVEGGNVLHHSKREGNCPRRGISGEEYIRWICPGWIVGIPYRTNREERHPVQLIVEADPRDTAPKKVPRIVVDLAVMLVDRSVLGPRWLMGCRVARPIRLASLLHVFIAAPRRPRHRQPVVYAAGQPSPPAARCPTTALAGNNEINPAPDCISGRACPRHDRLV